MPPDEKKEKVLHARIPESLDEEIREHAANLGLSVSNLVRNVLQNALGLVEEIVADTADLGKTRREPAARSRGEGPDTRGATGAASDAPWRILGWQEAILELNAVCDRCNAILAKGSRAAIAIVEGAGPRPIRCLGCIEGGNGDANARD
ncbi:MAG: ribbon-helix-helix protein, CopG family [Deltaproteobacteria bacterium]|nr:ribbon-helix-helix protein, CopG family [Deltaproteobacteria bacterium]